MKNVVTYRYILKKIDEEYGRMKAEAKDQNYASALESQMQVIALVKLLEVNNCGSYGGYDEGQYDTTLAGRIAWLKAKLDTPFVPPGTPTRDGA